MVATFLSPILLLFASSFWTQSVRSLECHGLNLHGPEGDGIGVTGGCDKKLVEWTINKDSLNDLKALLKEGNVYVRLRGSGAIPLKDECIGPLGGNLTIDGTMAEITITGPKFLHLGSKSVNVVIAGLCFKGNDNAIDMTDGGGQVWVTRNSFFSTSFGSPTAFRGFNQGKDSGTQSIHVSRNWYGPSSYGVSKKSATRASLN